VAKDDDEADGAYLAIQTFYHEAGALLNLAKSAFLRLNNCTIGPQRITESMELKILGVKFTPNISTMININFERLTANVKFMTQQSSIRNLNLIQKVWFVNTFVLSKLWFVSQVIPPGNKYIAQLRTAVGNFLWAGHLYRIDRRKLWLPKKDGGLALISIEDKVKALFLKNLMLRKSDGLSMYQPDFLYTERHTLTLPRNFREWAELSTQFNTRLLTTTKLIYTEMQQRKNIVPKIEEKLPAARWTNIWRNLASNILPTDWSSSAYLVIFDVIPSGQKLHRHRIVTDPPQCSTCGMLDSTDHRVKYCNGSSRIWNYLTTILISRLNLRISNPSVLLERTLDAKGKAELWYTIGAIWYNIRKYRTGQLEEFKQEIRSMRWQKRKCLEKLGSAIQIF
jgi:hypothetical protein